MGIARAAQSPIHAHRGMGIQRLRHRDLTQTRCFWWSGKSRRGWLSVDHDDLEARLRRHQALMIHRYTKAMKRRATWDRETTTPFSWKQGSTNWEREMSSTQTKHAKVEEPESKSGSKSTPEQTFHKDFESFKRAVDYAIARDPVGTLFGRRLRSPISSNNSSWTSWSWIFDPKDIKEPTVEEVKLAAKPEQTKAQAPPSPTVSKDHSSPSVAHTSSSSKTTTSVRSSRSIVFQDSSSVSMEYVYDPISGKKIVKEAVIQIPPVEPKQSTPSKKVESNKAAPAKAAPKDFLSSMFGEHGVDIPVKTYKPHKVYGYGEEAQKSTKVKSETSKESFGTSLKREYDSLRWRTLGNNIDATNFNCEPWNNRDINPPPPRQELNDEPADKKIRTSAAPAEDTPLFSGTTYQDKSTSERDWLASEGFRARQGMTMSKLKDTTSSAPSTTTKTEKLQPAIDRPHAKAASSDEKKPVGRLQPAIDRAETKTSHTVAPWKNFNNILLRDAKKTVDQREDIDLLRPSDIRAASKTARVTKQEIEDEKVQRRQDLQRDYDALAQAEQNPIGIADKHFSTKTSASTDFGHVWKHIANHPTGIVAKTMQSLGLTTAEKSHSLADYKVKNESLVARSTATIQPVTRSDLQLQKLGKDLKAVYEEEHGRIDVQHEQNAALAKSNFSEPTVKPGVTRNLEMEKHTQEFEPKYAELLDGVKQIHRVNAGLSRDLASISQKAEASRRQRRISPIDGTSSFVLLKYNDTEQAAVPSSHQFTDQIPEYHNMSTSVVAFSALSKLPNPSSFVQWFGELDKMGYTLTRSSNDSLLFQKPNTAQQVGQRLRNKIAAQEAAAQPDTQQAANVLDDIPKSVPTPGPAAPVAPVTGSQQSTADQVQPEEEAVPATKPRRKARSSTRMTRQEPVFSGQQRLKPQTTALPDPEHFQKQNPSTVSFVRARWEHEPDEEPQMGYFRRFTRFVKRVILTGVAFGAGAYGIGVIAEGLQGKAQIAAGESGGPMKRLVLEDGGRMTRERQRSGIYSTESSR